MNQDCSIVMRFIASKMKSEYLARHAEPLLGEAEWHWVAARELAHVFPSHLLAQAGAAANEWQDAEGHIQTGMALVMDRAEKERRSPHPAITPPRVLPEDAYRELERRGLA